MSKNIDVYYDEENQVLKNKLNIKDSEELEEKEYILVGFRMAILKNMSIRNILTMNDYKMIHHHIFQDVYEWAGTYRTVDIHKGDTSFLPCQFLKHAELQIDLTIKDYLENQSRSKAYVCEKLSQIMIDLNYMHPFREGNGRTQREFVRQLAILKGYKLNIVTDNHLYMEACVKDDPIKMQKAIEMAVWNEH